MKKLIILPILLLFLVGCNPFLNTPENIVNYKEGYPQIGVNFADNLPPKEVYENSQFRIAAEISNDLGYDVNNFKINLIGIDDKFFNLVDSQEEFYIGTLEGKDTFNPVGGRRWLEIPLTSKELFKNAQSYTNYYYLKLNYNSNFELSDSICVNPNFYDLYNNNCKMSPQIRYSGQGAPLAVEEIKTSVSSSGTGAYLKLDIIVKNKGIGKANSLMLRDAKLGDQKLDCNIIDSNAKVSKIFKDDDQEARIVCETFLATPNAYETLLYLYFDYDYEFQIKKNLRLIS
jgi:hypothetical protein